MHIFRTEYQNDKVGLQGNIKSFSRRFSLVGGSYQYRISLAHPQYFVGGKSFKFLQKKTTKKQASNHNYKSAKMRTGIRSFKRKFRIHCNRDNILFPFCKTCVCWPLASVDHFFQSPLGGNFLLHEITRHKKLKVPQNQTYVVRWRKLTRLLGWWTCEGRTLWLANERPFLIFQNLVIKIHSYVLLRLNSEKEPKRKSFHVKRAYWMTRQIF